MTLIAVSRHCRDRLPEMGLQKQPIAWRPIAMTAAKVIGGLLLFSGVTAGSGHLMKIGGTYLASHVPKYATMGFAMTQAGDKVFLVGKTAFLSVAVPVYMMGWVVPKWIVTVAVPKGAAYAHKYLFVPLYNGMIKVSSYLSKLLAKTAQAIYDYVLEPLSRCIMLAAEWVWRVILDPLISKIAQIVDQTYRRILPLLQQAINAVIKVEKWILRSVLDPLIRKMAQIVGQIYHHVLIPLERAVSEASKWIWNALLIPCIDHLTHIVKLIDRAAIKTVKAAYIYFVKPIGHIVRAAVQWSWNAVLLPLIETSRVATVKIAQVIYRMLLSPMERRIASTSKWIWQAALLPAGRGVVQAAASFANLVARVSEMVYRTVIAPVGLSLVHATAQTMELVRAFVPGYFFNRAL